MKIGVVGNGDKTDLFRIGVVGNGSLNNTEGKRGGRKGREGSVEDRCGWQRETNSVEGGKERRKERE